MSLPWRVSNALCVQAHLLRHRFASAIRAGRLHTMQILGPDEGALPTLPDTPILERLLFEAPLIPTGVLAVGVLIALSLVMKSQKRTVPLIAAAIMLVLAVAVPVVASMVTTEREVLAVRAEEFVAAVAAVDGGTLQGILTDSASLGPSDNASSIAARHVPRIRGKDQIIAAVHRAKDKFGSPERFVSAHKVLETRAALESKNTGRTLVRVRVEGPGGEYMNHSWWDITWKRSGDSWLASRIEAVWVQG
ncbi:MAG: hypothetical protein Phyf2KO_23780 [Phycisphaerales bacterium]